MTQTSFSSIWSSESLNMDRAASLPLRLSSCLRVSGLIPYFQHYQAFQNFQYFDE